MGRKNRQRKPEPFKCCETCANMQPIGEGDHICDACCSHDGSPTALVLESYIPATTTSSAKEAGGHHNERHKPRLRAQGL
jgi:hypothetical protein